MLDCRYYDMCFRCGDECNGEPECPHRRTCQFYSPMPDREKLLALADEIWKNADLSSELHSEMLKEKRLDMALTFHEYAYELREYAERIREALGVVDGQEP